MVLDPNLAEHLSHFGIDMLKMQKVRPLQFQILLISAPSGSSSLPVAEVVYWRELLQLSQSARCVGFLWETSRIIYSFIEYC